MQGGLKYLDFVVCLAIVCCIPFASANAQTPVARVVGTVKSVNGNSIVIARENGPEASVTVAESARIVKATPGQTDLKSATPIQVSDIQPGDRLLVRGQPGESGTLVASSVIVMKQSDIASRQQQEREEWRRGVGGIVKAVNAPAGTVTITNALASSGKPILIHVSQSADIRRYAPDSVKFDDAKPGTLDQIKPGDQLRARGTKSGDETEFTAQAIVSGTFRQIAGTVVTTDAGTGELTVTDLLTKKLTTLQITAESQIHKLPVFVAQRLAARLKGGASSAANDADAMAGRSSPNGADGRGDNRRPEGQGDSSGKGGPGASSVAGGRGNWHGGGTPDFQQMLSRMPSVSLSDLQKGDAVLLVATEGGASSAPVAITLLTGVEPILNAVPSGAAAAIILSPWNLGASPGGGDAAGQ